MLSYDDVLSRVHISVTGLNVIVDQVTVERSTDMVNWTMTRGGSNLVPVGQTVQHDDYEFSANVPNHYRVRSYDTAPITYVTGGPGATGNNASLVPALPLGLVQDDLLLVLASIRNSPTGAPVQPAGYTTVLDAANMKMFAKKITGGEVAPTVTFTGGVANATTLAQCAAFRNCSITAGANAQQLNPSGQDIPRPFMAVPAPNMLVLYASWKQDDWTQMTSGPGTFTNIMGLAGVTSTLGDDASQAWSYWVQTTKTDIAESTGVVTGGAAAISRATVLALYPEPRLMSDEIATITPMIDTTWLKVIARPYLNRPIDCIATISSITRRARNGIFPIVGRSYPVAVTDLRMSREFSIRIVSQTTEEREDLDLIMATGDVFFFQSPPGDPMPTLYAAVGDTDEMRPLRNRTCGNDWRVFTLPLTEIAAPTSDIVGSIGTWQTVVNTYATWSDVLADNATWSDLLNLVGSPSDVIVP
jgi:hypothetical protein